jgi:predicted GIY-YIG superfamily endonuclease/ribosomal protein S27AE
MPNPDYSKSCIYMLRHKDDTELENIYIGSTTNFKGRKHNHKASSCKPNNQCYNHKQYQYIRANGGWEEWRMIWLEDYPCNSKRELELREDEVMLHYENRLNDRRASRTHSQYYEDNKERLIKKNRENYKKNKELIAEQKKEYYEINKEKINEKQKEKIKCNICGCEIRRGDLKRHQRTIKCQSHL